VFDTDIVKKMALKSIIFLMLGDVDAQLHGCLLSMGADQQVVTGGVTHHLANFAAAAGASFTRRDNSVSSDVLRRQSMVSALCRMLHRFGQS